MDKKNILVLFGGVSPEHEVSKVSADSVIKQLPEEKYHVIPVYITKEGKWLLYDGTIDHIKNVNWEKFGTPAVLSPDRVNRGLLRIVGDKVRAIPVDVVFPVLHGENGEDGTIQGLCALAGIPCVGCGVLASAVSLDKIFMKVIATNAGLPQAKCLTFARHELAEDVDEACKKIRYGLGYPCFVKPANAGSSVGITKATNKKALLKAFEDALNYSEKIVVEEFIKGREIVCGVIGGSADVQVSVPGEVIPGAEFFDYDDKYNNGLSKSIFPAKIPEDIAELVRQMSANIFRAVDGSGLARVDFFLCDDGRVVFGEINTVPGFTGTSLFAKAWEASGLPMPQMLEMLIELAYGRQ